MKNNFNISVIIPVYRVENYIEKCIQSLLDQTYKNFEAIIIDDGSPDDSIKIAKRIVTDDPRFVFLEKVNGGQGSARNLGIDYARGEYLAFIDSDDYIDPLFLESLYQKIVADDADIAVCDVNIVEDNNVSRIIKNDITAYSQSNDFLLCLNTVSSFMCDKLFKKPVFDGIRFDENIRTYEDSHLVFRLIYGKKLTRLDKPLYNYVQRVGSTTNSISRSYQEDKLAVYNEYLKFSIHNHLDNRFKDYITFCYLQNYVYITAVGFARYSESYSDSIGNFKPSIDTSNYNLPNIFATFRRNKKICLGLLVFKYSPSLFKIMIKVRDHIISKRKL